MQSCLLTDVHYVALLVDHDVAVVPVLDLQEEPDDGVRRHRRRESPPRPLESLVAWRCVAGSVDWLLVVNAWTIFTDPALTGVPRFDFDLGCSTIFFANFSKLGNLVEQRSD